MIENHRNSPFRPSTCLASDAGPAIIDPPCSPLSAKNFAPGQTASTGFENKLNQALSKQIKVNQSKKI